MGLTLTMPESPPALQAITRLPDVLKAHAISQAAFRLAASISERKYGNVYPRANDLLQAVENTQIPDADFQAVVGSLLRKFIGENQTCFRLRQLLKSISDTFRQRTLVLLSKAYTSIPLSLAQSYLNCLPDQVISG